MGSMDNDSVITLTFSASQSVSDDGKGLLKNRYPLASFFDR
jgi:hypothetical protein